VTGLSCEIQYEEHGHYPGRSCLQSRRGIVIICGVYYYASSSKRVVRSNISSATSNGTAPAISCIWDIVLLSEGQDTGKPRTYIRFREVLRHRAYELEDDLLGRDGREERERGRWRRCKFEDNMLYTRPKVIRSRVLYFLSLTVSTPSMYSSLLLTTPPSFYK